MDENIIGILREGLGTKFWKALSQEIQEEFNKRYKKLLKCKRDSEFYKIQGACDALKWIENRPGELIDEIERTSEEEEEEQNPNEL